MAVRRRKRRGGNNMDLQEFKDRLEAQGVSYETFKERVFKYALAHITTAEQIEGYITYSRSFDEAMQYSFSWHVTPEGHDYWLNVAHETRNSGYKITRDHAAEAWLKGLVEADIASILPDYNLLIPKAPVCECGGEKCGLPHVHWCPMWKEV